MKLSSSSAVSPAPVSRSTPTTVAFRRLRASCLNNQGHRRHRKLRTTMRLATLVIAAFAAAQAPTADAVIAKMDAYLESYEPQLSSLVADETMRQEVRGNARFRLEKRIESE